MTDHNLHNESVRAPYVFFISTLCRLTHALMLSQSDFVAAVLQPAPNSLNTRKISIVPSTPTKKREKVLRTLVSHPQKKRERNSEDYVGAVSRSRNHFTSISLCPCLSNREGKNKLVNFTFLDNTLLPAEQLAFACNTQHSTSHQPTATSNTNSQRQKKVY